VTMYSCAQLREVAPELALGVLGGAERAEALIHVNGCARCQALVNELTEVADTLPMLAPEHEPPPGFEQRVLSAGRAERRRRTKRWVAAIAVAAAAAAIVSITVVRVVDAGNEIAVVAAAREPVEAQMITPRGDPAGWAYVTNGRSVAIAVDYGIPSGEYSVAVLPPGGDDVTIGTMTIADYRGSWTGKSDVPLPSGSRISLVDADGEAVCHGTVERA
jgi:hypothetical protein